MLRLQPVLRKMNCVSCKIAIFSQSQSAISQIRNFSQSILQPCSVPWNYENCLLWKFISEKIYWLSFNWCLLQEETLTINENLNDLWWPHGQMPVNNCLNQGSTHRAAPETMEFEDRTAPGPKKPEKSRTNSHRVVCGPGGAWIPGLNIPRIFRKALF